MTAEVLNNGQLTTNNEPRMADYLLSFLSVSASSACLRVVSFFEWAAECSRLAEMSLPSAVCVFSRSAPLF